MLVTKIWSMQPGKYFCLSTRRKGKMKGGLKNHWFQAVQFHLVAEKIRQLREGNHVWFCAHGFSAPRRITENAEPSHFLYADLDEVHPNSCPILPSMAVESSPGRYVGYWYVGEAIDWERDNQAWTKLINADAGGWDPTQVLRAPTSFNHKHSPAPRVKTMWQTGTKYTLKEIRAKLPKAEKKASKEVVKGAAAVYRKWENILPRIYKKGLLSATRTEADRSTWMWRVGGVMMESGIPLDDIYTLLWNSGNNKYRGRKNGETLLRRELDKKLLAKFERTEPERKIEEGEMFVLSMADVEEEEIDWVWEPYVARGELTIVEGDPGIGKSWLAQMLGIAVANGGDMPGVHRRKAAPMNVFFFDHENSMRTVMKPRLIYNGLKNVDRFFQEEKAFSVDDEDVMEKAYEAFNRKKPGLCVFDVVMNYAGGANVHNSAEVARMFGTFRDIAIKYNCAVVVLRHLTKDTKARSMYRGQGSITFTGTARCVIGVGYDGLDPDGRLFKVTKTNLTDAVNDPARRFFLRKEGKKCKVEFDGTMYVTNDQLFANEQMKADDDTPVIEWLTQQLHRPRTMTSLVSAGKAYGYDQRIIDRAAAQVAKSGPLRKGENTLVLAV